MNINKNIKNLGLTGLVLLPSILLAQTVADPDSAITAVAGRVDKVGEYGSKAAIIAGGLALAFVVVSFVRKARR